MSDVLPGPLRPERRLLVAGVAVLCAGVFLLIWLAVEQSWDPLLEVDELGRDGLNTHFADHGFQVDVLKAISRASTPAVYAVILLGVLGWLLRTKRWRVALFTAVAMAGYFISPTVKEIVERPRPVPADPVGNAGGFSFPSGHATQAMIAALVLLVVVVPVAGHRMRRAVVGTAAFCVVAIGFSRLGLGVHYVSDVLAGYAAGAAWIGLLVAALVPHRGPARHDERAASSIVAEPNTRSPS